MNVNIFSLRQGSHSRCKIVSIMFHVIYVFGTCILSLESAGILWRLLMIWHRESFIHYEYRTVESYEWLLGWMDLTQKRGTHELHRVQKVKISKTFWLNRDCALNCIESKFTNSPRKLPSTLRNVGFSLVYHYHGNSLVFVCQPRSSSNCINAAFLTILFQLSSSGREKIWWITEFAFDAV